MGALSREQMWALLARHNVTGELARTMIGGSWGESRWDPDAKGDWSDGRQVYRSWGLFQLNDEGLGSGLSVAQRCDPDTAVETMLPVYRHYFGYWTQQGLSGTERAWRTCCWSEMPRDYQDPNSDAAQGYREGYTMAGVEPAATDGARANFMGELESNTGTPYEFGGKTKGHYDCSGLLTDAARRVGLDLGVPEMTSADDLKQHCDPIGYDEVQLGDLLLFHSTYGDFGPDYATHCGASYGAGTHRMYDAHGDPWPGCGVTDISGQYWQDHLLGAWRPRMFNSDAPPKEDLSSSDWRAKYDDLNSWTSSLLKDTLAPTVADLRQLAQDIKTPKTASRKATELADRLAPFVGEG